MSFLEVHAFGALAILGLMITFVRSGAPRPGRPGDGTVFSRFSFFRDCL